MTRASRWHTNPNRLARFLTAAMAVSLAAACAPNSTPEATLLSTGAGGMRSERVTIEQLRGILWNGVQPGTTFIVTGDQPFTEALHITSAQGTLDEPIVLKAAEGNSPVFASSIVVEESAHVVLDGLTVRGSSNPGVIVRKGSHHVTVRNCSVRDNWLGIWLTDGAGCSHAMLGNEIAGNATHGIAVDDIKCEPGNETLFAGNRIHGNGHHGIEVHGNYYVVEQNEVFENGARVPGTSGIHVFSRDASKGAGRHNVIRFNVVHDNKEAEGPDGNGIQLDRWCDENVIAYNIVFANDGAGIIAFESANDKIYNNTLFGNMLDPDGKHPFKGEIVLAADADLLLDRANDTLVTNNVVVASRPNAVCIAVDRFTTEKRLDIGNNLFHHAASGNIYSWGETSGADAGQWAALTQQRLPDQFADPMLQSETPSRVEDFRPRLGSPALGGAVRLDQTRDATGKVIAPGKQPDLGALEYAPK